ncbi:MAG: arsenate reductase (glutaredoxin) [Bacteroidetes bacterium]|nr:MAG: arsenate reductase (glutaredoxin) [Bacteroidota bacterium]
MKIYHNTRCKKSRAGLQYLQGKTSDFEIVEYLKDELSIAELTEIFKKLGIKPEEMIRKQEKVFKEDYKGKSFSNAEWIKIITENPKLLNRPIIVKDEKAVWGDPPENIDKLF